MGNIQLNWISIYLLNRLENPNLFVNDIENANKILEIKNLNDENIKQIKRLEDQMNEEFNQVKQLKMDFKIKD